VKQVENPFITQKAITDFKIRIDSEIQNEEELRKYAIMSDREVENENFKPDSNAEQLANY
jgi:hypothetical protein